VHESAGLGSAITRAVRPIPKSAQFYPGWGVVLLLLALDYYVSVAPRCYSNQHSNEQKTLST